MLAALGFGASAGVPNWNDAVDDTGSPGQDKADPIKPKRDLVTKRYLPHLEGCARDTQQGTKFMAVRSSSHTLSSGKNAIAVESAKMLIECKAILFNADKPFTFTSGLASPVYTDMRKVIAYPRIRSRLVDFAVETIETEIGYDALDIIAGGETAGIPFAAWISDRMNLPMQYVRKKPKGFGRNARIEGEIKDGAHSLLVEDLATDGGSKVNFCNALREAGQRCDHTFVFFFYDIFPKAREMMAEIGVGLHYLVTWRDILAVARQSHYFEAHVLDAVEAFLDHPLAWSAAHGGVAELALKA